MGKTSREGQITLGEVSRQSERRPQDAYSHKRRVVASGCHSREPSRSRAYAQRQRRPYTSLRRISSRMPRLRGFVVSETGEIREIRPEQRPLQGLLQAGGKDVLFAWLQGAQVRRTRDGRRAKNGRKDIFRDSGCRNRRL